jgi:hypothetical protein
LINNRQGGRRRGRGGGSRPPGNVPNAGNRQENRQRGNAAQLLEKYKAMARDAQMSGDRVLTEYYLQFADHYHRVLNESRARFEEQRRYRDDYSSDEDEDQEESAASEGDERDAREASGGNGEDRQPREHREHRNGEARESRPRRQRGRRRDEEREDQEEGGERISLDVLPPAIAPVEAAEGDEPKPRRRLRRPRSEGGEEIAPAA